MKKVTTVYRDIIFRFSETADGSITLWEIATEAGAEALSKPGALVVMSECFAVKSLGKRGIIVN